MFSLWMSQQRVKKEQASLTLTQETSYMKREGGMRNLTAADFAEMFW
jgi:hypothetical protein